MAFGKRFLIRHVGNMGDLVFFIPPVLATLKKTYLDCHITLVTAWGYKSKLPWHKPVDILYRKVQQPYPFLQRPTEWGGRTFGGYCISLLMTNPHVDQLIHWHDTKLDLSATTCCEEGHCFPTWNKKYYEEQKRSGPYDRVFELDFGLAPDCNPIQEIYKAIDLPTETYSHYQLYFTEEDKKIAETIMVDKPRPRIMLLESLATQNTRGWDINKISSLEGAIKEKYGVVPLWFGGQYIPHYQGQPLTLRQNVATMLHADVAIGVLSGPLHFAAAVGLPTLILYGDQPLHRAAPAYFLNEYVSVPDKRHRTLMGPTPLPHTFLKGETAPRVLTPREQSSQNWQSWLKPGRQSTKSCLAPLTVAEIMTVLEDMLPSYYD